MLMRRVPHTTRATYTHSYRLSSRCLQLATPIYGRVHSLHAAASAEQQNDDFERLPIGQQPAQASKGSSIEGNTTRLMGMIYSRHPRQSHENYFDNILEALPTLENKASKEHIDTAVLLVTPSFAELLEGQDDPLMGSEAPKATDSSFMRLAMEKIFCNIYQLGHPRLETNDRGEVHVSLGNAKGKDDELPPRQAFPELNLIVGIVDKLPGPQENGYTYAENLEGMAYYLSSSRDVDWRSKRTKDEKAHIRLCFDRAPWRSPLDRQGINGDMSLTVPTANTLFSNGQHTTLRHYTWRHFPRSDTWKRSLQPSELEELKLMIRREPQITGNAALAPLTPWRSIKSVMGNVVSEVEFDGKAVPASKELEAAVDKARAQVAEANAEPDQISLPLPFSNVYAVISSGDSLTGQTHTRPPTSLNLARFLVDSRVHRVTGGGGGWGIRAGILSLDPSTSFAQPANPRAFVRDLDMDSFELPDLSALGHSRDIARPGEMIAFFHDNAVQDMPTHRALRPRKAALPHLHFRFHEQGQKQIMLVGTVSKGPGGDGTVGLPIEKDNERKHWMRKTNLSNTEVMETLDRQKVAVVKEKFGILSEQGVAVHIDGIKRLARATEDPSIGQQRVEENRGSDLPAHDDAVGEEEEHARVEIDGITSLADADMDTIPAAGVPVEIPGEEIPYTHSTLFTAPNSYLIFKASPQNVGPNGGLAGES